MNIMTNLKVYLPNKIVPLVTSALKWRIEVSNSYYSVVGFVDVDLLRSEKPSRRKNIIQKRQEKEKLSIF